MHILWLATDNIPSWISERRKMAVEIILWSISTKVWDLAGIKLLTPVDLQSDLLPTALRGPVADIVIGLKNCWKETQQSTKIRLLLQSDLVLHSCQKGFYIISADNKSRGLVVIGNLRVNSMVLALNAPIPTKVVCFSHLLKCLRSLYGKQCGHRTACSYRSSLFRVHTVSFYT